MQPHRVLDLDLDFFLDHIARWRSSDDSRLRDGEFTPWTADAVRRLLEDTFGLDRLTPIPGRCVTHHDEAFAWWRGLIEGGQLSPPFEVVHVDAHADLGLADGSAKYIMGELLKLPVDARTHPRAGTGGLNAGNYLAFAAACRWLCRIEFVLHPEWEDDLEHLHFKDFSPATFTLQLKDCDPSDLEGIRARYRPARLTPEPEIPFDMAFADEYRNRRPITHGLLCQSPAFTPPGADALIDVVMEYFRPV